MAKKKKQQEIPPLTIDMLCALKGKLSSRDKFILNVKYRGEKHSLKEWEVILQKERLV